jgi:hypothetical protein
MKTVADNNVCHEIFFSFSQLPLDLTPEKLLSMYRIAVSTLEVNLETIKFMFNEEQKLQEKLSQQSEQLQKLVNQSESL